MIILDGRQMKDPGQTHAYLKKQMNLPFYYGCNLDALYDILTAVGEGEEIYLFHGNRVLINMPEYGRNLIQVFKDAQEENENLRFWTNVGKEVL